MMYEHLFSYILIGLMGAASISYLFYGNFPMATYWVAGAILNISVLWNNFH